MGHAKRKGKRREIRGRASAFPRLGYDSHSSAGIRKGLRDTHGLAVGTLAQPDEQDGTSGNRTLVQRIVPVGPYRKLPNAWHVDARPFLQARDLVTSIDPPQRHTGSLHLLEQHADAIGLHSKPSDTCVACVFPYPPKRKHHT